MQVTAYISKHNNKFICSIVATFESSPEVYCSDSYFDTLYDALLCALFYDNVKITLDPYCDAIAYLGVKIYMESMNNSAA